MKQKNHDKTKLSTKIFSGLFFLTSLTILIFIGISLGKKIYRKHQIQKEIEDLETQISQLKQKNDDMKNLISYLSSTDFKEREAREKLNLQKSDEKMIILRKDIVPSERLPESSADSSSQNPPKDDSSNFQKWWKFFFAKEN